MINPISYSACSEFYEVVKSVEFVKEFGGIDRMFRIDALYQPETGVYSTRVYIEESVTLQPAYPNQNGKRTSVCEDYRIWVVLGNAGSTNRDTAEAAIQQALGFLGCSRP